VRCPPPYVWSKFDPDRLRERHIEAKKPFFALPTVETGLYAHTHTHTHTPVLRLYGFCPGEPVPEETFTHSHLSWSSIVPYLLHPSTMIHGILPVQSTCLTVFLHNLFPSFLWSISWPGTLHFILHTFLHPIIVFFLQHVCVCVCVCVGKSIANTFFLKL